MEHDHPRTFDFLRSDIRNINDFFARRSVGEVKTLGMRQTWDFIVGDAVDGLSREDESGGSGERRLTDVARAWLNAMDAAGVAQQSGSNAEWSTQGSCLESIGDEAVFMSSFIPRSLREVHDPERDVDTLKYGQGEQLIYVGRSGMYHSGLPKATDHPASGIEGSANEETFSRRLQKTVRFDEEVSEESLMDGKDLEDEASERRPRGFRFENKEAKKVRQYMHLWAMLMTEIVCRLASRR